MKTMARLFTGFIASLLEAWQELRIHKLRVLLSLVGVTIAVASLTTAVAGASVAQQLMTEQLERSGRPALINTYAFNQRSDDLPAADAAVTEAFKKTTERFDVEYASMVSRASGYRMLHQGTSIDPELLVVDPAYASIHRLFAQYGRWLEAEDVLNLAPAVVIDRTVAQKLGLDENSLPASVDIDVAGQVVSATVIGATSTRDGGLDGQVWMLPQTYEHWFAAKAPLTDATYEMWVPVENAEELAVHFSAQMRAELPSYQVETMRSDYLTWGGDENLRMLALVAGGVAGIILLLGSLSLLNVAMVTMKQRIREVGIRRSFGATTGRVFFSVLMESVVATAVAGGIGVLISVAVVTNPKILNMFLGSGIDQMPPFPVGAALAGILISIGVGALTGVLPALVAARVKIVDAIRV